MNDPENLSDSVLPPLLEFDVIYYFYMEREDDSSGALDEIRVVDILKVEIKDMGKSKRE